MARGEDEQVRIVAYDPSWPGRFEEERALLNPAIGKWVTGGIHHIGSTSVPGLAAKPVIDILAGVKDLPSSRECIGELAKLAYQYAPYRSDEMHWFCKPAPSHRTHHLHLVPTGSRRYLAELAFRDTLRARPALAAEYAGLKERLAAEHVDDREAYTEAKQHFIAKALELGGPGDACAFRPITRDDIDQLAAFVAEGFAGYRSFSPANWTPPAAAAQADVLRRWMTDPDFWGELALAGPSLLGHAAVIRADRSTRAPRASSVAHLGHLFVAPGCWGTGLAPALLSRAMHAAAGRGFEAMRLFVAVGQARARRFYAREGFGAIGEPFDPGLGLPVLEYRRPLS